MKLRGPGADVTLAEAARRILRLREMVSFRESRGVRNGFQRAEVSALRWAIDVLEELFPDATE